MQLLVSMISQSQPQHESTDDEDVKRDTTADDVVDFWLTETEVSSLIPVSVTPFLK